MLKYKGYSARVELDEDAGVLRGEVIGARDVIPFQADTVERAIAEFHASVDGYLALCEERGETPEKPLSGQFLVRSTPELHHRVHVAANDSGMSVNAWLTKTLEEDTKELLESRTAEAVTRRTRDEGSSPAAAAERPMDGESRRHPAATGTGEKPAPDPARVLRQIADALEVYLDNLG